MWNGNLFAFWELRGEVEAAEERFRVLFKAKGMDEMTQVYMYREGCEEVFRQSSVEL